MSIEWFEVNKTPPPFKTQLLTKGIDSGSYYKWDSSIRETVETNYKHPYVDIGIFTAWEADDDRGKYGHESSFNYDSAAISSDKNSYELWNEIKLPTHWAFIT
jgi:hypothetical protein